MQDELYLVFENYLNNEMSQEDRIVFEKKLETEPELLANFNLYKETSLFVEHKFSADRTVFRENLKNISGSQNVISKPQKTRTIKLRPIFYAVAAVLVLFFGLQLFQGNPTYEEYNQFETASISERGDDVTENLKKAEKAFNDKKYKEAIPLFESILKQNKTADVSYLYGIALLQENRTNEAEKVFYDLKKENSLYTQNAIWCLALTKLKQKDYAACKASILELSPDADYYEVSRKLLKELD